MRENQYDDIKFCAFCPNFCRIYYPPDTPQKESMTPSALSYLGLAVLHGLINHSKDVEAKLSDLQICEACQKACPYHYRISDSLQSLVASQQKSFIE
jgi:hypothetical protein